MRQIRSTQGLRESTFDFALDVSFDLESNRCQSVSCYEHLNEKVD